MFIGNLFYKDKTGDIKELSAKILSRKITSMSQGRDFSQEELEHIISVISFYLHNSPEHTLIEETDIEQLVTQLYGSGSKGMVTIEGVVFDDTVWQTILRELHIELPSSIARRFFDEFSTILVYLSEQHGLSDISRSTVLSVLRDLCKKYTVDYTPPHALSFPLQEVLLLYAKYPPQSIGTMLSPVFNRYIYQHFMLTESVKKLIAASLFKPHEMEPFHVDQIDCNLETLHSNTVGVELIVHESSDALPLCASCYLKTDITNPQKIISGEKGFVPWESDFYGITYAIKPAALFDESLLPIYPSIFNAYLHVSLLHEYTDIVTCVKALNALYVRYAEYFYLIEQVKGRKLFMKLHVTVTSPEDYDTVMALREELPDHVLIIQHLSIGDDKVLSGSGILLYAYCEAETWNENKHEWCQHNGVYMMQCTKEEIQ